MSIIGLATGSMLHPAVKSCCAGNRITGEKCINTFADMAAVPETLKRIGAGSEGGGDRSFSRRYKITAMRWNCSVMDWLVQGAGIGNRRGEEGQEQIAPLQYDILRHKA